MDSFQRLCWLVSKYLLCVRPDDVGGTDSTVSAFMITEEHVIQGNSLAERQDLNGKEENAITTLTAKLEKQSEGADLRRGSLRSVIALLQLLIVTITFIKL